MRRHRVLLAALLWLTLVAACPERGKGGGEQSGAAPSTPATQGGNDDEGAGDPGPGAHESGLSWAREPDGPADRDAVLRVRLEAEPAHLEPLLSADAITVRVALGDIYEGLLCQRHPTAPAEPCLARTVHENAAGTVFTFEIRPDVSWHDGARMSVDDVVFTYRLLTGMDESRPEEKNRERRAGAALESWLAADFDDLVRIERRGDDAVVMSFEGFRLGRREAFARVPILPRHVFGKYRPETLHSAPENRAPVGTGPLAFRDWRAGEGLTVVRFDDYWGTPAGAARVEYRVLPDRSRTVRAMASGTLDLALRIPADRAGDAAEDAPGVLPFALHTTSYLAAVYNVRNGVLADADARRGLTLAMDRKTLSRVLFSGQARVISGPYMAGDPDRHPDIAPLPYDPDAAATALARARARGAGSDEPLVLEVLVPTESRSMRRLADIWAQDVSRASRGSAAGQVRLEVVTRPFADVLARLRQGDFEIALMAFTTGLDLDLYSRFATGALENYGGLADPELTRALAAVRAQSDADERRALQWRVQERLHALQPYTFITDGVEVGLVASGVGGFDHASAGARSLWRAR